MQIHNDCKIAVLVGCCERFFQTKLSGGTSGNGRILSLYERNIPYKRSYFPYFSLVLSENMY